MIESYGEPLAALDLAPTEDAIAGAAWECCGVLVELSDGDRRLMAYAGWQAATWPGVKCGTCGLPMCLVTRPVTRAKKVEPAPSKLLTKAEMKERHAKRKAGTSILSPERPLHETPFGLPHRQHFGKKMCDVPRDVLVRALSYYRAKKRGYLQRSRELAAALAAAIEWIDSRPDTDFPRALLDDSSERMPWETTQEET